MPDTVTPLEAIYTACMVVNLCVTGINLAWAQNALSELKWQRLNGQVEVLRRGARNDQIRLVVVALCLVVIGSVSLLSPQNLRATTGALATSGGAFILLSACLVWLSFAIRLRPHKLRMAGPHNGKEAVK